MSDSAPSAIARYLVIERTDPERWGAGHSAVLASGATLRPVVEAACQIAAEVDADVLIQWGVRPWRTVYTVTAQAARHREAVLARVIDAIEADGFEPYVDEAPDDVARLPLIDTGSTADAAVSPLVDDEFC